VTDPETATFFHSPTARPGADRRIDLLRRVGHHLRGGKRGDPDIGWVGRYKEPNLTPEQINGLPEHQRQAQRGGNIWTAATFGVFAVQDGATVQKAADFDYLRVSRQGK